MIVGFPHWSVYFSLGLPWELEGELNRWEQALERELSSSKTVCPWCREEVNRNCLICPHCHEDLRQNCPHCGEIIPAERHVCPKCNRYVK